MEIIRVLVFRLTNPRSLNSVSLEQGIFILIIKIIYLKLGIILPDLYQQGNDIKLA